MQANFDIGAVFQLDIVQTLLGWALILFVASAAVYAFRRRSGDPNARADYDRDTNKLANALLTGWDVVVTGTGSVFAFIIALVCIQTGNSMIQAIGIFGASLLMAQLPFISGIGSLIVTPIVVGFSAFGFSIILTGPIPYDAYNPIVRALAGLFGLSFGIFLGVAFLFLIFQLIFWAYLPPEQEAQARWVHPWLRPLYSKLSDFTLKRRQHRQMRREQHIAWLDTLPPKVRMRRALIQTNAVIIPMALMFSLIFNFIASSLPDQHPSDQLVRVFAALITILMLLLIPASNVEVYFDVKKKIAKKADTQQAEPATP